MLALVEAKQAVVIEPDGAVRERLRDVLGSFGYATRAWATEEGLRPRPNDLPVELVLGGGGLDAIGRVGDALMGRPAPRPWLLAVLDPRRPDDPSGALLAGADDFVQLPIETETLRARLGVAERALAGRRAEASAASELRSLFDGAAMMLGVGELVPGSTGHAGDDFRIVSCNHAVARWFRVAETSSLEGRTVRELGMPEAGARRWVSLARASAEQGAAVREEFASARDEGWLAVSANALGPVTEAQRFTFVVEDISQRVKLQQQLLLADRLVSMGTLAAGVAHEINNPLMYVMTNLDLVRRQLAQGTLDGPQRDRLLRALGQALEGSERVRQIVRGLRTFSRGDDEPRGPVHVVQVLTASLDIAHNALRHRARLRRDFQPVPPVEANEARLGQVFLNLLVNAAQAIDEDSPAEANEVSVSVAWNPARERVVVSVQDTGRGIPPALLGRVFDPFFTTKTVGEGTGLGLSICHGIVKGLGGDLEVESTLGVGTTFRVLLPPSAGSVASRRTSTPPVGITRRLRVLVVDDEANLRLSLVQILSIEHEVEEAGSARVVLDRVRTGARWDVILCDLMMPDMSGIDLFAALEHEAPSLARRTIFLTGGAFTARAQAFLARVPNPRLEKPFDIDAMRSLLQRVAR